MSTLTDKPTLRDRVRARPVLFGGIAVAAIAVLVVVLVVFQPQRLLYDTVVDDEFPVVDPEVDASGVDEPEAGDPTGDGSDDADAAAEPEGSDDASASDEATATSDDHDADEPVEPEVEEEAEPTGPVALATGEFISRSRYTVTGGATIYELEDGSRTLRLEDFESTNGPSLFVYLTSADAEAPHADLDADFIDLGELRGNVGNQNYDVPADIDLDVYDTVVIWCRPFTVAFGAADLS